MMAERGTHLAPTESAQLPSGAEHWTPEGELEPRRAWGNPPHWLVFGLAAGYVAALLGLIFLPGGTLLERLRALDGGICAQLPTHSFYPGGQQLPLCARNTGIYMGFSCTLLVLWASGRGRVMRLPSLPVALVLGAAVVVMAVDGFNSLFLDLHLPHLYQPHNLLRLATGLGTGTAMAAFLLPVVNGLVWREEDDRPSFGSFGQLAVMLPVLLLTFLAVASQAGWLLYPLALMSSAGLVVAVSFINLVFVLGLRNRVGEIATVRQLFPLYSLVVVVAVVELLALFALKSALLYGLGAPSSL
jgi:uncharacterized membrane protein